MTAPLVDRVPEGWTWVVAIVSALLFPVVLLPVVKKARKRLGLLGVSAAAFIAAGISGALRGNAVNHALWIYSDAMLCLCLMGLLIVAAERKKFGRAWGVEEWRRFGGIVVVFGMVPFLALSIFIEFGPTGY